MSDTPLNEKTVPAEDAALVEAFETHITRERKVFQLIAIIIVIFLLALVVGAGLIYHNATNPARILKVVDQEFANQARQQQTSQLRTDRDVCSLLERNHLHAGKRLQADLKCSVALKTSPVVAPNGEKTPAPSTHSGSSGGSGSSSSGGGGSTPVPEPTKTRTIVVHKHHSGGSGGGGGGNPAPTPTPTCTVLSLLGRCIVP